MRTLHTVPRISEAGHFVFRSDGASELSCLASSTPAKPEAEDFRCRYVLPTMEAIENVADKQLDFTLVVLTSTVMPGDRTAGGRDSRWNGQPGKRAASNSSRGFLRAIVLPRLYPSSC